jgi:MFS family permease
VLQVQAEHELAAVQREVETKTHEVRAGEIRWLSQIQAHPAYLTHLLPSQLLGGIGVGLTVPSLIGAGSAALPPARFGTGSGVLNMGRQVGTVLGVAGLVAILARLGHGDAVTTYRHGLELIIGFFIGAAVAAAALLTRRPVPASAAPRKHLHPVLP